MQIFMIIFVKYLFQCNVCLLILMSYLSTGRMFIVINLFVVLHRTTKVHHFYTHICSISSAKSQPSETFSAFSTTSHLNKKQNISDYLKFVEYYAFIHPEPSVSRPHCIRILFYIIIFIFFIFIYTFSVYKNRVRAVKRRTGTKIL